MNIIYSFHQNEKKTHFGFYILIAKSISWYNCVVNYRPVIKSGGNTIIGTRESGGAKRGCYKPRRDERRGKREVWPAFSAYR